MKNYSNNIIATLCYIVKDDKVLMLKRVKKENDIHHGKYNGLGGKLEKGETPYECVIREVKEESGLLIKNPILKGILNFPDFDGENDWIVFVYIAKDFDGDLIYSKEGVLEWIDIKDILKIPLWEGDKVFLKYIFKDKGFFYGTFYYKNKKLIDFKFQII
jgi:8-oxo-dGTP diphosphatase